MLEVAIPPSGLAGSIERTSNADSRSMDGSGRRRDHGHQVKNHSHHRRRHSAGHELSSGKKRSNEKGVSSGNRPHPRPEYKEVKHVTNNSDHTPSRSVERKRRRHEEPDEEEDVWTEHKSSSGRVYYYNKRLDKSQWEKPEKGTLKKLKSDSVTPKSSGQHSGTKSHSAKREAGSSHHHGNHHASSSTMRHGQSESRRSDRKSSVSNIGAGGSSPSTPVNIYQLSSVISPTAQRSLLTATQSGRGNHQRLTHGQFPANPESPLMSSSQLVHSNTPSLFGGVDHLTGPVTPMAPNMLNYIKGGIVAGATPLTPGVEGGSLHPLQHTAVQYSQVYPSSPGTTPLHVLPQNSAVTSASRLATNFPFHQPVFTKAALPITTQRFQSPMSKLGRWVGGAPPPDSCFPDPESLQPLPHPPSGSDMFSRVLSDMMWTGQFDGIQKQIDHAQLECCSRKTVDHSYHCGQLARSLLSLECSRIKAVSRSVRLSDLKKLKELIEKR